MQLLHNCQLLLCCLVVVLLLPGIGANGDQEVLLSSSDQRPKVHRIAIVGAGAAGSSAAYHLSQFARDSQLNLPTLEITIFETNDYVGGRTTTVNALDDPRYPTELGGSIFVEANEILLNATRDFGLSADDRDNERTGAYHDLGIWDGTSFVFTVANRDNDSRLKGTLGNWWDMAKLFWKYGLSPIRLRTLQQATIGRFLSMYHDVFPFKDLTQAAAEVDLLSVTNQTGRQLLAAAGVGEKFSREVIQASTRVNYAQNLHNFHGLETMVCMSTEGAMSIDGGNWRIFDQMVKRSGAKLLLNHTVQAIHLDQNPTHNNATAITITVDHQTTNTTLGTNINAHTNTSTFDTIILAKPYHHPHIPLHPFPLNPPIAPTYVTLHVTLLATSSRPHPPFFNLAPNSQNLIPDTILTTLPSTLDPSNLHPGQSSLGPTPFWSLSTLRTMHPANDTRIPPHLSSGTIPLSSLQINETLYLYKIFSPTPLNASFITDLFGWCANGTESDQCPLLVSGDGMKLNGSAPIADLPGNLVSWSHEKVWQSYPYEVPTARFDCFDLFDAGCLSGSGKGQGGEVDGLEGRVWYTGGIERFISTMETSALAGRNVAKLIIEGLENGL